ncbi:MAG: hypothetical protein JOY99_12945 [Sphingomonadaceae bacterium]|nr:hypothetical protein [Sphingomonadaceae bacterium]
MIDDRNRIGGQAMSAVFDASEWLDRFTAAGGWFVAAPDGRICTGWTIDGRIALAIACRDIWREIADDEERRAAVRSIIRDRSGIAA